MSDAAQRVDPDEDTSAQIAPVPDYDAPDEEIAKEGDSPPDSLLGEPIPREQQPGILRVQSNSYHRPPLGVAMLATCAPGRVCLGYCRNYGDGPIVGQKLGHV